MEILQETQIADRVIFHFNKAHLADATIPMWVIKFKGQTHYVDNVISEIGFKTKNTPDNPATKGSLQIKGKLKITRDESGIIDATIF